MSGAHGHGHGCAADHHRGEYTERQRADLDLVLAFNHRLVAAIEDNVDVTDTIAALDPDPLRYMWVDEGDGQIPAQLAKAAAVLDARAAAGRADRGRPRGPFRTAATRPAPPSPPAVPPRWSPGWSGRRAAATGWWPSVNADAPRVVVPGPEDLFRPTAAVTADGVPWLVFGRSGGAGSGCGPAASSTAGGATRNRSATPTARRSTRRSSPSEDGGLHVCWQGRAGGRFAVFARRWNGSGWEATVRVSERGVGQRLGPEPRDRRRGSERQWPTPGPSTSTAATPSRCAAIDARGGAGPVRRLTGGSDYALHPSLATTTDGRLWCAFDVVIGARPRRQRPHPPAAPAHPGRPGRRPRRHAGAGQERAARAPARGQRAHPGGPGRRSTRWWSRPASWRAG